jgi:deoxyribonuclease-4
VAKALDKVHKDLAGYQTITCLEITAGQGSGLGYCFEHLRQIIDATAEPERLAICFDTAHALEAGYDLTSAKGMRATLDEFDEVLGLDLLKVVHVNDSKTPRGSRVDRHAHIGHGHVSTAAFGELVNDPHAKAAMKILETPKEKTEDGRDWDTVNVAKLRRMVRRTAKGTKKKAAQRK